MDFGGFVFLFCSAGRGVVSLAGMQICEAYIPERPRTRRAWWCQLTIWSWVGIGVTAHSSTVKLEPVAVSMIE